MKDTLAHVLERKCSLKICEAKKVAACARQNLELPQTFLWSKELEKEAIRLCYEQNPKLARESIPNMVTVQTGEPPKEKDRTPKVVSPIRRCRKQPVAMVEKSHTKSPDKKKKRKCSLDDVVDEIIEESGVLASQQDDKASDYNDFPIPEPDFGENDEPYLTEKTVPSLLPPLRADSYCTVDSLFSSGSIQDDFAHASDWSAWLTKNDKWSTLRDSKRVQQERKKPVGPKRVSVHIERGDSGPRVPVRRLSCDYDDFEYIMRGV